MEIYRLSPINPMAPDWQASTHRDIAVVRAGSEEQARSLADNAFVTRLAKLLPGPVTPAPLWHHPHAVRAEVMHDPLYRPEGPAGILEPWGYS